jgi:hypothetical protein
MGSENIPVWLDKDALTILRRQYTKLMHIKDAAQDLVDCPRTCKSFCSDCELWCTLESMIFEWEKEGIG